MTPDKQWTVHNFYSNWNTFKQRHPEYYMWDYNVTGFDVVMLKNTQNALVGLNAGYVWDIGAWSWDQVENHLLNLLSQLQPKGKDIPVLDQDKLNEKASKDGELFAEIALYISGKLADLPMRLAYPLTSRLAKALGYVDTDSNDAFKGGWMSKMENYQSAQPSRTNVLLDKPQTYE